MSKYKYRIVKKTLNDGTVRYYPQKRDNSHWLWRYMGGWFSMSCKYYSGKTTDYLEYTNAIEYAKQVIDNDIEKEKEHKAKKVKSEEVVRKYNATI